MWSHLSLTSVINVKKIRETAASFSLLSLTSALQVLFFIRAWGFKPFLTPSVFFLRRTGTTLGDYFRCVRLWINLAPALEQINIKSVKMEARSSSENRSAETSYTLKQMENKMNFKVRRLICCDFKIRREDERFEELSIYWVCDVYISLYFLNKLAPCWDYCVSNASK